MALIPAAAAKIVHVTMAMVMAMVISNMDQIRSQHHHRDGCHQDGSRLLQDRPGSGLDCRLRRRVPMVTTTSSRKGASTATRAATRHRRLLRVMVDTTNHLLDGISMAGAEAAAAKGSMTKAEAEVEGAAIEVEGVIEDELACCAMFLGLRNSW